MPRSLASCYENLVRYLDQIAHAYGRRGAEPAPGQQQLARLPNMRIETSFQQGLHEFVKEFIAENNRWAPPLPTSTAVSMRIWITHETIYRYEHPVKGA